MWVRLIHLAQQQQRNTYKIIKFPKDSIDSKWGLLIFLKPGMAAWPWWDSWLALALSYSPVKESLIRSGWGDDEKGDWCLGTWIKPWVRQAHLLRDACGSNMYRWKHSTWLNLVRNGYWAVIHELITFFSSGCRLVRTTHRNSANAHLKLPYEKSAARRSDQCFIL